MKHAGVKQRGDAENMHLKHIATLEGRRVGVGSGQWAEGGGETCGPSRIRTPS